MADYMKGSDLKDLLSVVAYDLGEIHYAERLIRDIDSDRNLYDYDDQQSGIEPGTSYNHAMERATQDLESVMTESAKNAGIYGYDKVSAFAEKFGISTSVYFAAMEENPIDENKMYDLDNLESLGERITKACELFQYKNMSEEVDYPTNNTTLDEYIAHEHKKTETKESAAHVTNKNLTFNELLALAAQEAARYNAEKNTGTKELPKSIELG